MKFLFVIAALLTISAAWAVQETVLVPNAWEAQQQQERN